MGIKLLIDFVVDAESSRLLFDFAAFSGERAVAVLAGNLREGDAGHSIVRLTRDGVSATPIDSTLVPGTAHHPPPYERAVLCPMGSAFALVAPNGTARWATFDGDPEQYTREDPFPPNQHGNRVKISKGGVSDDPSVALVFLRENYVQDVTRFARLAFDPERRTCAWQGLRSDGDAPWLSADDFPVSPLRSLQEDPRPIFFHGSWREGRLRLFTVGLNGNYVRWGMDYSIAATVENGRAVGHFTSPEQSYGTYSASGRYLILQPHRGRQNRSSLLELATGEVHDVKLPRGYSKFVVADHAGETFWLTPVGNEPLRFVACHAA